MILECNNARCKPGICAMWRKGDSKPMGLIDPETGKPDGKGCATFNEHGVKTDPMSLDDLVKRNANLKRVGKQEIKMDYILGSDGMAQLVQDKKQVPTVTEIAPESKPEAPMAEVNPAAEKPVETNTKQPKSPGGPRRIK